MRNVLISNDRIKHRYFRYLKEAKGHDDTTIDAVAKSLARFEAYTKRRNFKQLHTELARGFKLHLADQQNSRTGKPLSKSTIYATLTHLKRFFGWLADQPGYRSRIRYADAEYFSPSERTHGWLRHGANRVRPRRIRSSTWSRRCHPTLASSGATAR